MIARWRRVLRHLSGHRDPGHYPNHPAWWLLELVFHLLDVLAAPDLLMLLNRLVKPGQRKLTAREVALAHSVFGNHIDYRKVRLDTRAHLGPRQFGFAYVGFEVINTWGPPTDPLLIHELIHVWQYQYLGSVYIPRALWAQHAGGGYNYGGEARLFAVYENGGSLLDFNYEQMGEVVADYFRLQHRQKPKYCRNNEQLLPVLAALVHRGLDLFQEEHQRNRLSDSK